MVTLVLSKELKTKLTKPLKIGSVVVNSRVLQSPISGVTDLVFRQLVRRYAPDENPISIQLFDCRPDFMTKAAQKAVAEGAKTIDINMGCPVNKITKKGGGSSHLCCANQK